ncbi:hypothetical protein [Alloactinosynnema sp. L-07]|uniref:DUF4180 domain-containing protein n=1 Tax=Alloactinosynnema sp. L-07 TaxID=1653480 RepID=UPI00065F0B89|nr:DUF4180 domain-containing protein [Alloactinosynnema sp. L-07]CRK56210.1 hypothetical protein [Alloactinosynnema sp. L-07]
MPTFTTIHDVPIALLDEHGPELATDRDVTDLFGELWEHKPDVVVVPTSRLATDFFELRTRVAGEIMQKFANYRLRLVVLGDITDHVTASKSLADLVRESNQGEHIWFLPTLDALTERLGR